MRFYLSTEFYPGRLKKWALAISPGYMKEVEDIRLLTCSEVSRLFPEADVISINFRVSLITFTQSEGASNVRNLVSKKEEDQ